MKRLSLIAAAVAMALTSSAQISQATDITDLALIYIGSQHRPDWNKELFYPYVVHDYADGTKSWMFDGFLMIEFAKWNKEGVLVSFGEFNSQGAKKEDWEALLDEQLGTKTGFGCRALDEVIGEQIPILGKPGHKHKVVMTMPSAELKTGITWGEINGKQLNFDHQEDRIEAQNWYFDRIVEKWNEAGFKNLELDGIYWVKEAFNSIILGTIKSTNDYVHSKGYTVYWVPYKTETALTKWRDYGVDVTYLQPSYYFDPAVPMERLETAIDDAWTYDLGLEVEFEAYNYDYDPKTGIRTKFPRFCSGLYDHSPIYYQRLVDYIDKFEEAEAYTYMPIAYYAGFQAVYDFMNSGNPKDHEIMDRIARIINKRHVGEGWDHEPSPAGIDEITIGDTEVVYAVEGGIYIADNAGAKVCICTVDGREVYSRGRGGERLNYGEVFECPGGIYIVRVGDSVVKVAVR